MPSLWIILSSFLIRASLDRNIYRRYASVPYGWIPMYLHMFTSLGLLMLSKVNSSLNSFAKPNISSLDTFAPVRTLFINSSRSSAVCLSSPLRDVFISLAISLTVSCKNFAYSILACNRRFRASCSFILS
eukprot:Gb_27295 [translate_table: standard]